MSRRKPSNKKQANTLRIIGGDWRSRKLSFVDAQGLRPTPDRIRETLFNWLQGDIYGASCLDLFAGSGALGFEALSRGAKDVVFIEKNRRAAEQLSVNLAILKSDAIVFNADALSYLSNISDTQNPFDIIFLDPPYRKGLLEQSLELLMEKKLIKSKTLIYLEHESEESFDWSSFELDILKTATAGQVKSFLLMPIP